MGISFSKRHHHRHHPNHQQQLEPPPQPPPTTSSTSSQPPPPLPPPPPPPQPQPPPQPSYAFAANSPHPHPQTPYYSPPPPLPPPPPPYYDFNTYNYQRPLSTHSTFHPYFIPPPNLWAPFRPAPPFQNHALPPPPLPAVPYVDHQSAKKIKNDINVRKETIKLVVDELNPDCHLVCFTFDAMVDGSITIMYFGKEGPNCSFISVYPDIVSVKIPFQKGIGQKFCQPSGNGNDLGFFDDDDLSKPLQGDVFPLVILAESTAPVQTIGQMGNVPSHAQITLAILEKNKESQFQVKVIKQILWVDGVRYELREIYGISSSGEEAATNQDSGNECVICMTDPKDTTVLPCRHMCLCSGCAKELRLQSNKCPICRQPIEELLEIKFDEGISNPFS